MHSDLSSKSSRYGSVVDLFCGAGGMAHGFLLEGFHVAGGLDIDPDCQYAFEHNNSSRMILKDIEETEPAEIDDLFEPGARRVLIGCAPCQPYSRYSVKNVKLKGTDERWKLVLRFADVVKDIAPDIVSMENVPDLVEFDGGRTLRIFENRLRRYGYSVSRYVVNCLDYGIPQTRRRLVVLASKFGKITLIPPTHSPEEYKTVRDAIEMLPAIRAGECDPFDPIHKARDLSDVNLDRIRASSPGASWESWPDELKLACHRKKTGESFKNVYGRMAWDQPSPTITTQFNNYGTGRFGHPEQDRAISLREGALLQTFPRNFSFVREDQPVANSVVARLIGNAVPVDLGRVVALSIKRHIDSIEVV
ncbi:MAG: DNA cytosine methyltransferase [Chloroflexi bacterium]|nr:DNA cytosine methyltransferase [Chloroflexota bacterium]RIK20101.1 MAG: DNA (cytosine-5-)-methyltransferase [Chloroflexota bacterium]